MCGSGDWGPELADPCPIRVLALPTVRYSRGETGCTAYEVLAPAMERMARRLNGAFLKSVPQSLKMREHFESWKFLTSPLVPVWSAGHFQCRVQPCHLVAWGLDGWVRSVRPGQGWEGEAAAAPLALLGSWRGQGLDKLCCNKMGRSF